MDQPRSTNEHNINQKVDTIEVSTSSSSSGNTSTRSERALPLADHASHPPSPPSTEDDVTFVSFEPNDPGNPHNWSTLTKFIIFLSAFTSTSTTSFYSTLTSNFSPSLPVVFEVANPAGLQRVLPASLYLAGAPLSESPRIGRWPVLTTGAVLFVIMSIGQAVAQNWAGFLVLRFLAGVTGSPPGNPNLPSHLPRLGAGTILGSLIILRYDSYAPRLTTKYPTKREEYLRLPLVCAGGPIYVLAMLWLGWSARTEIHWAVPLAAMVPYGMAYQLIYVPIINYVADAYGIYSASALAAMSMTRSMAGALLPLAIEDMVEGLGIAVPFAFIGYGERIRAGSQFSKALRKADTDGDGRAREQKDQEGQKEDGGGLGRVTSLSAV
ncbi:hypothetical protein N0V88_002184 [Collariella sp. IMI 366227]|nr:hypothetical protein N0V88_002184 [Collariella sp. IMI 366227]